MPKHNMRVVTSYGGVYRITNSEYKAALRGIISGEGYQLDIKRYIGEMAVELANVDPDKATTLLREAK